MNDGWRDREAPERVEQKLIAAYRGRRRARRIGWMGAAVGVAAALAVIALISSRPREAPHVAASRPERPPQAPQSSLPHVDKAAPVAAPAVAAVRQVHRRKPLPAEVTTGFLPLDAAPMELNGGELVRMEVPRSTLTLFGLPMDARRASVPVQADVLFGEDGMAHAVRFVATTSYEVPTMR